MEMKMCPVAGGVTAFAGTAAPTASASAMNAARRRVWVVCVVQFCFFMVFLVWFVFAWLWNCAGALGVTGIGVFICAKTTRLAKLLIVAKGLIAPSVSVRWVRE